LRKRFGFDEEGLDPDRCFRESRRRPHAPSTLSPQKQMPKVNQGGKPKKAFDGG
jgi:hypothetical protein